MKSFSFQSKQKRTNTKIIYIEIYAVLSLKKNSRDLRILKWAKIPNLDRQRMADLLRKMASNKKKPIKQTHIKIQMVTRLKNFILTF